jgi:hypothetical protein
MDEVCKSPQQIGRRFVATDKSGRMLYKGCNCVKPTERMACIDANLDDVQAGLEACSRAADTLQADTARFNGFLNGSLVRSVVRHVKDLQACARDQSVALQELRDSIAGLREELVASERSVRPPPLERAKPPGPPNPPNNNERHECPPLPGNGSARHSSPRRSR